MARAAILSETRQRRLGDGIRFVDMLETRLTEACLARAEKQKRRRRILYKLRSLRWFRACLPI